MATEGKKSPFTFKNIALSGLGLVFTTWLIPTILGYYFDTTFLKAMQGWLQAGWDLALLDTPMPNWSLLMLNLALVGTLCAAIYFYRTADAAYTALDEAERVVDKLRNPDPDDLSRQQIMILMNIANLVGSGLPRSLASLGLVLGTGTGFKPLQLEIALDHLAKKGFVEFVTSASISSSSSSSYDSNSGTPCLTLKGKEFVQARRERNAELAEQKAKAATPES